MGVSIVIRITKLSSGTLLDHALTGILSMLCKSCKQTAGNYGHVLNTSQRKKE